MRTREASLTFIPSSLQPSSSIPALCGVLIIEYRNIIYCICDNPAFLLWNSFSFFLSFFLSLSKNVEDRVSNKWQHKYFSTSSLITFTVAAVFACFMSWCTQTAAYVTMSKPLIELFGLRWFFLPESAVSTTSGKIISVVKDVFRSFTCVKIALPSKWPVSAL